MVTKTAVRKIPSLKKNENEKKSDPAFLMSAKTMSLKPGQKLWNRWCSTFFMGAILTHPNVYPPRYSNIDFFLEKTEKVRFSQNTTGATFRKRKDTRKTAVGAERAEGRKG